MKFDDSKAMPLSCLESISILRKGGKTRNTTLNTTLNQKGRNSGSPGSTPGSSDREGFDKHTPFPAVPGKTSTRPKRKTGGQGGGTCLNSVKAGPNKRHVVPRELAA